MKNFILLLILSCSLGVQAQIQKGLASYYDDKFEGRKTSSGEIFQQSEATAAHRSLDFGTLVRVTNLKNNKQVVVRINDRGPFIRGRIIDLSKSMAKELDFLGQGVTEVEIEVISKDEAKNVSASSTTPQKNETTEPKLKEVKQKSEVAHEEVKQEPESKLENQSQVVPKTTGQNSSIEYFSIEAKSIQPDFYGVQIGSFREMVNLMRFTAELKTAFKEHITVQSKSVEDARVYTVILGKFSNRELAERFQQRIAKTYNGAFIVDMTK